jgi:methionine aminotransferase
LEKYPEIVLLSDEVYEYITFEAYFSSYSKKLLNRSVMVSSFGKSFHVTGWKVGYLVARIFDERNQKVHQF